MKANENNEGGKKWEAEDTEISNYTSNHGGITVDKIEHDCLYLKEQSMNDENYNLRSKIYFDFGFEKPHEADSNSKCNLNSFLCCCCVLMRSIVSKKKKRFKEGKYNLDLSYIKPTIIAMGFPSKSIEGSYRNNVVQVTQFLKDKHGSNVKIYNLCSEPDKQYNKAHFGDADFKIKRFPFPDHNITSIQNIFKFCIDASLYLQDSFHQYQMNQQNEKKPAIAVHCKAGKGRTGLMICSLLIFTNQDETLDLDDQYSMNYYEQERIMEAQEKKKKVDDPGKVKKSRGLTIPSQIRQLKLFYLFLKNHVGYPYFQNSLSKYQEIMRNFKEIEDSTQYFRIFSISLGPFTKEANNINVEVEISTLDEKGALEELLKLTDKKLVKNMIEWYGSCLIIKFSQDQLLKTQRDLKFTRDIRIKIHAGSFKFYFWLNPQSVKEHSVKNEIFSTFENSDSDLKKYLIPMFVNQMKGSLIKQQQSHKDSTSDQLEMNLKILKDNVQNFLLRNVNLGTFKSEENKEDSNIQLSEQGYEVDFQAYPYEKLWSMLRDRTKMELENINEKVYGDQKSQQAGRKSSKFNFYSVKLQKDDLDKFKPNRYKDEFSMKIIIYEERVIAYKNASQILQEKREIFKDNDLLNEVQNLCRIQESFVFEKLMEDELTLKDNYDQKIKKIKGKFAKKNAKELLIKYRIKFNTLNKKEFDEKVAQILKSESPEEFLQEEENQLKAKLGLDVDPPPHYAKIRRAKQQQEDAKYQIMKLEKEKKEREKKNKEILEIQMKFQQDKQQKEQELKEQQRLHEEELKELRKQEVLQKIEEIQQRRVQKKQDMIQSTKQIFQNKSPPKFIELEKRYQEQILMPELEEQKKKLQMIRDIHKPISQKDILRHQRRFDHFNRKVEEERENHKEKLKNDFKIASLELGRLKSNILDSVVQQDLLLKQIQEGKSNEIKNQRKKVQSYSKYVQEMYQPKVYHNPEQSSRDISPNQREEKRKQLRTYNSVVQKRSKKITTFESPEPLKTLQDDDYERQTFDKSSKVIKNGLGQDSDRTRNLIWEKERRLKKKHRLSFDPDLMKPNRVEYKDYLKEQRIKNMNSDLPNAQDYFQTFERRGSAGLIIASSLDFKRIQSPAKKNEIVQQKIKLLDDKFKLKEKANRVINKDLEFEMRAHDNLVENIKTKLQIIDQLT
ncbi:phosphatidylinositol-trisphosphate 3-phosphatase and dual-specificity protein phosphatase pten [Stylonychia lemnae]|uniref:phosphatidylinositol-3,4,5-trisphosphate 3-phosphatase n=1 Tax=Stylonychia lemnae TaxID=5949 RepID=A0A078B9M8_STYLE|nr:phosphatidylinositol-trisphosphate 3-phosphatase and dual-specificity protein phosphatase pten [Stylonychia lemnae]|eukprot:CDW91240.1 phosphatidylinositol-trisphosphate 3-phosphatase and dual-specificity protein phosphatase pten [Stylonychia lemnae]